MSSISTPVCILANRKDRSKVVVVGECDGCGSVYASEANLDLRRVAFGASLFIVRSCADRVPRGEFLKEG